MTQEELLSMVQRFGPSVLKTLGIARGTMGPASMATMGDGRPENSKADMGGLTAAYAAARAANQTPNGHVARGFDAFGPQASMPQAPMLPTPPTPAPVDMGPPPALAQAMAPQGPAVPNAAPAPMPPPMPAPRPPAAPAALEAPQEMPWYQRNAAMMRDPSSGQFIDPAGAERAQASGPDVIAKLMSYFHQKDS